MICTAIVQLEVRLGTVGSLEVGAWAKETLRQEDEGPLVAWIL